MWCIAVADSPAEGQVEPGQPCLMDEDQPCDRECGNLCYGPEDGE